MYTIDDLHAEAQEAVECVWFVQTLQILERTDPTITFRLGIRPNLFVHVFLGTLTGSLYFALIEQGQRIFGIDLQAGEWHMHPYDAPHQHEPVPEGLDPKPLLRFLAKVEPIILEHDLL